jgi:hypothetical protein
MKHHDPLINNHPGNPDSEGGEHNLRIRFPYSHNQHLKRALENITIPLAGTTLAPAISFL